jgi:tetratricopeptide (TPR) repeat protein
MSDANNEQLRPPPSWDKFEEICADLFSRIWNDAQVVRYGTSGQAQHGVDIFGKDNGRSAGVQCKGKRDWPPTKLTIAEIDAEVEKAKTFAPKLASYIIATTAENDTRTTDRATTISEEHARKGLFRVSVYGWTEIVRRLQDYPDLLKKHFSSFTLRRLEETMPDAVADRVVERLNAAYSAIDAADGEERLSKKPEAINSDVWERDFTSRYERTLQRSMYPELHKQDEFAALATEAQSAAGQLSDGLRRLILFRASRAASIQGRIEDAKAFLSAGTSLPGATSDIPARARLSVAEKKPNQAIQLLRDETDADARTVLLSILFSERGDDEALHWFSESGLSLSQFTAPAVHVLAVAHLRANDLDAVNRVLSDATPTHLLEAPYLYFLRGAMRFARLLPKPEQAVALSGLPMQVHHARPIVADAELSTRLDEAINDLRQALPLAAKLGLRFAPRMIESYILWCELLHPTRKTAALAQLRRDMEEPSLAIARIQYALAYDPNYSPANLESYLRRRDSFGGLSDDELRAFFVILLSKNDAAGLVDLIAAKRQQAEASFDKDAILFLEIQALAKKGDATSAKIVFDNSLSEFDDARIAILRAEIAKAEGADPVAEHLHLYETTKTADSLRALVGALMGKNDQIGIAKYAELLFAETSDPRDLAVAAQAALRAGDGDTFVRLIESHAHLKKEIDFLRSYGWQLFRLGQLKEAKEVIDEIERAHPADRDLSLEFAVALDTGDWETLAGPLTAALEPSRDLDGLHLIRAAYLSQASRQGPLKDLIAAALAKDGENPHVLLGAYQLYVEEGLEEEQPETFEWFRKALALSGPDGPIQSFEMKELLSKQIKWNEHTREVNQNITRGDMPLVVAGPGLRTTIVDIVLRNLVRNANLTDARRRAAIPLFSGRRLPAALNNPPSVALDITAVLVLSWLGLMPKVLEAFSRVVLPAGLLIELFEGQKRIRLTQRSRLQKALEVRDAIAKGRIKVLRTPDLARDALSAEIGTEMAALIREADATKGVVIRPAPINKVGLEEHAEADMNSHAAQLCDTHGLLKTLCELNVVDQESETSAKRYFDLQDRGWPNSAPIGTNTPLFLDGLTVVYLQYTGLLQTVLNTFKTVFIHSSTEEEASVLIEYDRDASEVLRIIDDARDAIRQAHTKGRAVFGPRRQDPADSDGMGSTLNLLSNLSRADVVVFDDRALNKEPIATDETKHRARLCSTLDLLEELAVRKLLSEDQYRNARYRLRSAGALLVPVNDEEIVLAACRNRQNEAPEFRAIRESFELGRISEMPQFPSEMRWFLSYVQATRSGIMRVWSSEPNDEQAKLLASQILDLRPLPENWVGRWNDQPPPNWIKAVRRSLIGGLAMPVEIDNRSRIEPYQKWFEEAVMSEPRFAPRHL